jgi:hypothetical protein
MRGYVKQAKKALEHQRTVEEGRVMPGMNTLQAELDNPRQEVPANDQPPPACRFALAGDPDLLPACCAVRRVSPRATCLLPLEFGAK